MNKFILIFALLVSSVLLPTNSVVASERFAQNKIESTVYITKTGKKYHRIGCKHLKSCITINRVEAIRLGYDACKVCKP